MSSSTDRMSTGNIALLCAVLVMGFVMGVIIDSGLEGGWASTKEQQLAKGGPIKSAYLGINQEDVKDNILRLAELFSSESFKQADPQVRAEAAMTLESFILQFGPALDMAKRTGETAGLGLFRARMVGDKDAEILYLRELGHIKIKPFSGD